MGPFTNKSGIVEKCKNGYGLCGLCSLHIDQSSQQHLIAINIKRLANGFSFSSDVERARYKASLCKESGAWLTVLPSKNFGTLLDNNTFSVTTALRLRCVLCSLHTCVCVCGDFVDSTGIRELSYGKSVGHFKHEP